MYHNLKEKLYNYKKQHLLDTDLCSWENLEQENQQLNQFYFKQLMKLILISIHKL